MALIHVQYITEPITVLSKNIREILMYLQNILYYNWKPNMSFESGKLLPIPY